jgi:hypothetical protein
MENEMKAFWYGILYIVMQAFRAFWLVAKLVIYVSVLWGAAKTLTKTEIPIIGSAISWVHTYEPSFWGHEIFLWVASNWLPIAVAVMFLTVLSSRRILFDVSKTDDYTRIFIGMMMNYLRIHPKVSAQSALEDKGAWKTMIDALKMHLVFEIVGMEPPDDRLNAKAMRDSKEVHFTDDIQSGSIIERDNTDN